jgi:hypothetical protein
VQSATATSTAAPTGWRGSASGLTRGTAGQCDGGQQPDGVAVSGWALGGLARRSHRPVDLEGCRALPAAELIAWHARQSTGTNVNSCASPQRSAPRSPGDLTTASGRTRMGAARERLRRGVVGPDCAWGTGRQELPLPRLRPRDRARGRACGGVAGGRAWIIG